MHTNTPLPHDFPVADQIRFFVGQGHERNPAENDTQYLHRLDALGDVVHLVSRADCEADVNFFRHQKALAVQAGKTFVMLPRYDQPAPIQAPVPEEEKAFTLTREQASDPAQYRAAREAALAAGLTVPIVLPR